MKPNLYQLQFKDGELAPPMTATEIARRMELPRHVVVKRLQRGLRLVEQVNHPVRVYAGNDGYRKPTLDEQRDRERARKHEDEWIDRVNTEAAEAEYDI